jgi:hypothetical protein
MSVVHISARIGKTYTIIETVFRMYLVAQNFLTVQNTDLIIKAYNFDWNYFTMQGISRKRKQCWKSICRITLTWILKKWGFVNVDWIQMASNEVQWCAFWRSNQGKCSTHVSTKECIQNFHSEVWTEETMWKPECGWEGNIEVKHIYIWLGWVLEHPGSWSGAVTGSCYAALLDQMKKYYLLQKYSMCWRCFKVI